MKIRPAVPVIAGPDGARVPGGVPGDIGQDAAMRAAQMNDDPDAWCAACGQHWAPRSRRGIDDGRGGRILLMLCDDEVACVATFRATEKRATGGQG